MKRDLSQGIAKEEIARVVRANPGLTTPELAGALDVPINVARWAVHECGFLEFYDGNHIRCKPLGFSLKEPQP